MYLTGRQHKNPTSLLDHVLSERLFPDYVEDTTLKSIEYQKSLEVRGIRPTANVSQQVASSQWADKLQGTCCSWNCDNQTLAVGYGRLDHNAWCRHEAAVCLWNTIKKKNSSQILESKPSQTIDVAGCITTLNFHPNKVNRFIGGTFMGNIFSAFSDDTQDIPTSVTGHHSEAITSLLWLPASGTQSSMPFLSTSLDGQLLLWNVTNDNAAIRPKETKYAVTTAELPSKKIRSRECRPIGITSADHNIFTAAHYLILGTEGGGVFQANLEKSSISQLEGCRNPVVMAYSCHAGHVTTVSCCPQDRNLFATGGTDGNVRLYNALKRDPIKVYPNRETIIKVSFVPSRPTLLIAVDNAGTIAFLDIRGDPMKSVLDIHTEKRTTGAAIKHLPLADCLAVATAVNTQTQLITLNNGVTQPQEPDETEAIARLGCVR